MARLTITLPDSLHRALKEAAARRGRPMGELIEEIEALLERIVLEGMVREPGASEATGPDPGDRHLWDLLATDDRAVLVTGDRALLDDPPDGMSVLSPRGALVMLESR